MEKVKKWLHIMKKIAWLNVTSHQYRTFHVTYTEAFYNFVNGK